MEAYGLMIATPRRLGSARMIDMKLSSIFAHPESPSLILCRFQVVTAHHGFLDNSYRQKPRLIISMKKLVSIVSFPCLSTFSFAVSDKIIYRLYAQCFFFRYNSFYLHSIMPRAKKCNSKKFKNPLDPKYEEYDEVFDQHRRSRTADQSDAKRSRPSQGIGTFGRLVEEDQPTTSSNGRSRVEADNDGRGSAPIRSPDRPAIKRKSRKGDEAGHASLDKSEVGATAQPTKVDAVDSSADGTKKTVPVSAKKTKTVPSWVPGKGSKKPEKCHANFKTSNKQKQLDRARELGFGATDNRLRDPSLAWTHRPTAGASTSGATAQAKVPGGSLGTTAANTPVVKTQVEVVSGSQGTAANTPVVKTQVEVVSGGQGTPGSLGNKGASTLVAKAQAEVAGGSFSTPVTSTLETVAQAKLSGGSSGTFGAGIPVATFSNKEMTRVKRLIREYEAIDPKECVLCPNPSSEEAEGMDTSDALDVVVEASMSHVSPNVVGLARGTSVGKPPVTTGDGKLDAGAYGVASPPYLVENSSFEETMRDIEVKSHEVGTATTGPSTSESGAQTESIPVRDFYNQVQIRMDDRVYSVQYGLAEQYNFAFKHELSEQRCRELKVTNLGLTRKVVGRDLVIRELEGRLASSRAIAEVKAATLEATCAAEKERAREAEGRAAAAELRADVADGKLLAMEEEEINRQFETGRYYL